MSNEEKKELAEKLFSLKDKLNRTIYLFENELKWIDEKLQTLDYEDNNF